MRLVFSLFKYFSFGGLQRDFLRIAKTCRDRGHTVDVYTMKWEGDKEPGIHVHIIPTSGFQNHTRAVSFVKKLATLLSNQSYDLHIGFNKMPGLDFYYAADVCHQSQGKSFQFLSKWLPRNRQWQALEEAVFQPNAKTQILLLSAFQQNEYARYHKTPRERFHLLPPGISKDRIAPPDAPFIQKKVREELGIAKNDIMLLMVGSDFRRKGVERSILSMDALPKDLKNRCKLFVLGEGRRASLEKLADQLGLLNQVNFMGGRLDVPLFLLAADFLLHPALCENTGTVILEALSSGLPVMATATCGYSPYIERANAGLIIPAPFKQSVMNRLFKTLIESSDKKMWRENALNFTKTADIYDLPTKAAEIIEQVIT